MGGTIPSPWASQVTCDYCDNTENIRTFKDRTDQEPDIHICPDCYESGAEPKLREMLEQEQPA